MVKRLVTRAAIVLAVSAATRSTFATDYYFNAAASSDGNGTTTAPFSSLAEASHLDFDAGDHVYLKGIFNGGLSLKNQDSGVSVSSWGKTPATINAGDSYGVRAIGVGDVSISNLNVVGSGPSSKDSTGLYTNQDSGIRFFNDSGKQDNIRINNVSVSGFGENGIFIQGGSNESGFNHVKITNSRVYQNQRAGLNIAADFDSSNRNAVTNVTIDHVKAYDNPGRANRPDENNSGNGIVIGQVNGAVIQNSIAWNNGTADASEDGGSVGIWAWDSNKVTIQHNESFNNGTAGKHDGGGFDLDGGVTNSVMQYNYSHDNAGAGYLLAEFQNAKNFANNEVKNNLSVDDGRKNGYGALHAFGAIDSASVHDNTVLMTPADKDQANTRDEAPAGIKLRGAQDKNIDFSNNLFFLKTGDSDNTYEPVKIANPDDASGVTFSNNDFNAVGSDADAIKLENLLNSLGGQLSSGKVVAIDANALSAYIKTNEPIEKDEIAIVDPKKDIVDQIPTISSKPVISTPSAVGAIDGGNAVAPEPSAFGLAAIAGAGLLRRRRRA